MKATHDWPENWMLICHTRYRESGFMRDYLTVLQALARSGSVLFSTEPLSSKEYPQLVRSADVGIVYYCPTPGSVYTQDNLRHIGLSSGKLASYLQVGIPVVVNDVPSLRRLTSTYGCGVMVEDPAVNRSAIELMLSDYNTYSYNAVRCFDLELDFEGRFAEVLRALDAL
jgi:glycosyltransferase involved in cell wall biosynthesis